MRPATAKSTLIWSERNKRESITDTHKDDPSDGDDTEAETESVDIEELVEEITRLQ